MNFGLGYLCKFLQTQLELSFSYFWLDTSSAHDEVPSPHLAVNRIVKQ